MGSHSDDKIPNQGRGARLKTGPSTFGVAILGAGPGGTGPLICASHQGKLASLLDAGVALADRNRTAVSGELGRFAVNSDTLVGTFLECLETSAAIHCLYPAAVHRETQRLQQLRNHRVPLNRVGQWMKVLGKTLVEVVESHPRSRFLPRWEAESVHLQPDGRLRVKRRVSADQTLPEDIWANSVVMALGGHQPETLIERIEVLPQINLSDFRSQLIMSDTALTPAGLRKVCARIEAAASGVVVIIGGSHSAFSVASAILHAVDQQPSRKSADALRQIVILHRSRIRVFYSSAHEAVTEGYSDFDEDDICPLTRRVHRMGGLRGDGRELYLRYLGLGNRAREGRLRVEQLAQWKDGTGPVLPWLRQAAVVIPALGYVPRYIPVFGCDGSPIELAADSGNALVDDQCRVLDGRGSPVPGLFGIGLASGFRPSGAMGGEKSFRGQTNGVWLYQHNIGEIILEQILSRRSAA